VTSFTRSVRRAGPAVLAVAAVFALAFAAACDDGGETATQARQPMPAPSPLTLVDGGQGGVTIQVTWVTPDLLGSPDMERVADLDLSRYLAFYVRLDTNSADLSKCDLGRISVLHDRSGGEYQPQVWLPLNVAGDHREGLLVFRKVGLGSEGVALEIRGVGGVPERSYRWFTLPSG
jgi:hypothetical protein